MRSEEEVPPPSLCDLGRRTPGLPRGTHAGSGGPVESERPERADGATRASGVERLEAPRGPLGLDPEGLETEEASSGTAPRVDLNFGHCSACALEWRVPEPHAVLEIRTGRALEWLSALGQWAAERALERLSALGQWAAERLWAVGWLSALGQWGAGIRTDLRTDLRTELQNEILSQGPSGLEGILARLSELSESESLPRPLEELLERLSKSPGPTRSVEEPERTAGRNLAHLIRCGLPVRDGGLETARRVDLDLVTAQRAPSRGRRRRSRP